MRLRCTVLRVVFALFIANAAHAQSPPVTGRVTDMQGGVVVNAAVTLTGASSRPITVRTNADGAFRFEAVQPGRYVLQIDAPGFAPWAQDVAVGAGMAPVAATVQVAGVIEDVQVSGHIPVTLSQPVPTASRLGLAPLQTPARRRRHLRHSRS